MTKIKLLMYNQNKDFMASLSPQMMSNDHEIKPPAWVPIFAHWFDLWLLKISVLTLRRTNNKIVGSWRLGSDNPRGKYSKLLPSVPKFSMNLISLKLHF